MRELPLATAAGRLDRPRSSLVKRRRGRRPGRGHDPLADPPDPGRQGGCR
ncbi:hypothetical protein HBB16_20215 [Pseudonocardia sp. MCCB 268]|nr:hypothetical protein [Pseudonocardia cytotoxica]